jgi:hypothetical protein
MELNNADQASLVERQAQHIKDLEQELRIVRRQLAQFQGRQMGYIAERRRAAMQFYREQYEREHGPTATHIAATSEGLDELDSW